MEIPVNVMNEVMEQNEENVILLSMSTLPNNPGINTYQIKEGNKIWYFKGISQLEAHTKYIIAKLASKKKSISRIIILESDESTTEKSAGCANESAVSFYKKRILQYIGVSGKESQLGELELKNGGQDPNADKKEHTVAPYKTKMEFKDIALSKETYFWEAVKKIRGDQPADKNINLYMDMQGGDRNSISQMNAIVELLDTQSVTVRGRYANDYAPYKTLHEIREVSKEYRTYDLITAMEVFKKYGWGEELASFFSDATASDTVQKLTKIIKDASRSISLCDVEGFDQAIRAMKTFDSSYRTDSGSGQTNFLHVVYEDIKRDYEPLFDPEYHYIAQIEWCLRKNFIQQAITIFESKMPYEYVNSGLIYYLTKDEEDKKDAFFAICDAEYSNLQSGEKYKMMDLNHYIVKDKRAQWPAGYIRYGTAQRDVSNSLRAYRKLCSLRNHINHAAENLNAGGVAQYLKGRHGNDSCWTRAEERDIKTELENFLKEWKRLARRVPAGVKEKVWDLS